MSAVMESCGKDPTERSRRATEGTMCPLHVVHKEHLMVKGCFNTSKPALNMLVSFITFSFFLFRTAQKLAGPVPN